MIKGKKIYRWLIAAAVLLQAVKADGQNTALQNSGAKIVVGGNTTVTINGSFTNSGAGTVRNSGNINITGNWTNNANNNCLDETGTGSVTFTGTGNQFISGNTPTDFYDLIINKNAGRVQLQLMTHVLHAMSLMDGIFSTHASALLMILDNAVITGGSGTSFVEGPIAKQGDDAFTFPTGKGTNYQPITITAPQSAGDIFTAEYFNSEQTLGTGKDASLQQISTCEYWNLDRTTGTSSVSVTLGWNNSSCNITQPADMRVAGWDGAKWTDHGNGASTGDAANGTVTSTTAVNAFGAFTVGNVNLFAECNHSTFLDIMTFTDCGLDYVQKTSRISSRVRFGPLKVPGSQATLINLTIPNNSVIKNAFIWLTLVSGENNIPSSLTFNFQDGTGNITPITANLILTESQCGATCWNPSSTSNWKFTKTSSYRASVPVALIASGNANYRVSNLPVSDYGPNPDVDGVCLFVIYQNTGVGVKNSTILIREGIGVVESPVVSNVGLQFTNIIQPPNKIPSNAINGKGFIIAGDLEAGDKDNTFTSYQIGSSPFIGITNPDFYNFLEVSNIPVANIVAMPFTLRAKSGSTDCFAPSVIGFRYEIDDKTCPICDYILNGGFEDAGQCFSCSTGTSNSYVPGVPSNWEIAVNTPDYYNNPVCGSIRTTCNTLANGINRTGNGSIGFAGGGSSPSYREFSRTTTRTLQAGETYKITFYAIHDGTANTIVPMNVGFAISSTQINPTINTPPTASRLVNINMGWVEITGYYQPSSTGLHSFVVGVFDNNTSSALGNNNRQYFFADDVSITHVPRIIQGTNISVCQNVNSITFSTDASFPQWSNLEWRGFGGTVISTNQSVTISSLPSQSFTVTLTGKDQNGCLGTSEIRVNILPVPKIGLSDFETCSGNVTINPNVQGAAVPYTYQWSSSQVTLSCSTCENPSFVVINSGNTPITRTINLTVTDANGCQTTKTIVVTIKPPPVIASINTSNASCAGKMDGSATVTPDNNQGSPPFTFTWSTSPPQSGTLATGLSTGIYTVTMTDFKGCSRTTTINITDPAPLIINALQVVKSCDGINKNQATAFTNGGTPPYIISWNTIPQQNTSTVTGLSNGVYTVTVSDVQGCSKTTSVTITSYSNPVVSIAPQSSTICSGQGTQLQTNVSNGATPYTFLWLPSTGLSCTNCFNPVASPNTNTTYVVSVMDANGCESGSLITINVLASPSVVISPPSLAICSPQTSTTLTATGTGGTPGYNYTWDPLTYINCVSCTTVTVNPPVNTTYTVTITDANNCSAADIVTVKTPLPPPVISGPNNTCKAFTNVYSLTGPYISYNWSISSEPGNILQSPTNTSSVTAAWGNKGGTLSVTVIDINGCSTTVSMKVSECCPKSPGANDIVVSDIKASEFMTNFNFNSSVFPGASNAGKTLWINGIFRVDISFTFSGATVKMGPDAKIIIPFDPNSIVPTILTINNNSELSIGCDYMWNGIYIESIENKFIFSDSRMLDAQAGIVSLSGGVYTVTNSILQNNYKNMIVQPYNSNHSGAVTGTKFLGSASLQWLPYRGNRTNSGMEINKVDNPATFQPVIKIGNLAGGIAAMNIFDNMDVGIKATDADVMIENNKFTNIGKAGFTQQCLNPPNCPEIPISGIAVYAIDADLPNIQFILSISVINNVTVFPPGNFLHVRNNEMTNCFRGVEAVNYVFNVIENNKFTNKQVFSKLSAGATTAGDHAVFVRTFLNDDITIKGNDLDNYNVAIHILKNNFAKFSRSINISNNKIGIGTGYGTGTTTVLGIFMEDINPFTTSVTQMINPSIIVRQNNIAKTNNGIHIRKITSAGDRFSYPPVVSENFILVTGLPLNIIRSGIRVEGGDAVKLTGNTITGNLTKAFLNNTQSEKIRGIFASISPSLVVDCNKMSNVGQAMVYEGTMPGTQVTTNTMQDCRDGLVLSNSGQIGGFIGAQGDATHPSDNRWDGTFFNSQTNTINSNGQYSPMWVRDIKPNYYPTNNKSDVLSQEFIINTATGDFRNCGVGPPPPPPGSENQNLALNIAIDELYIPVFSAESRWMLKRNLFRHLMKDSALLLSSAVLYQFYDSTLASCIGKLERIGDLLSNAKYDEAQLLNNSIQPIGTIENNFKIVNNIYLSAITYPAFSFTLQQLEQLTAIARQCPLSGGEAVYIARALLNYAAADAIEFDDNCDLAVVSKKSFTQTVVKIQKEYQNIQLYPNPNKGVMQLEYELAEGETGLFEIYSVIGEKISEYLLFRQKNILNIKEENLQEGIYYYRLKINGDAVETGKLVIVK